MSIHLVTTGAPPDMSRLMAETARQAEITGAEAVAAGVERLKSASPGNLGDDVSGGVAPLTSRRGHELGHMGPMDTMYEVQFRKREHIAYFLEGGTKGHEVRPKLKRRAINPRAALKIPEYGYRSRARPGPIAATRFVARARAAFVPELVHIYERGAATLMRRLGR